ncbi:inositol 1,4,5-trisphosphate receptor-interacting protein [Boleophthalmus pectinirostris]|uniref:inositol 1,4,5-trisphosphate receptor-interacting protein n=1 Tax=Boleophthalmus pectinirostris TaxID=150288 RepID=UPI0024303365|nr:inositol 1,4,5-trisphosphate receptor-interacting protein [Boleophthalmus pectinirostris]
MQGVFARLCVVVAATIFNPLLFPHENTTVPEQDDQLLTRMREHEEKLALEQAKLDKELSQIEHKQEEPHTEPDYSWYFWSMVSFVIFLTIELCRGNLSDLEFCSIEDENESETTSPRSMVLSKHILQNFCERCTLAHENSRLKEFVEGFADDLLEAHRGISEMGTEMEVGDFVGVGSMFESWQVCKPMTCDLIVPFSPPDPYYFQFNFSDIPPNMQGSGVITVSRFGDEGCLCCSTSLGEDMICLLHPSNNNSKPERSSDELLCSKNTNFLSKQQVMKWFQISITKSWSRICHKYDFELTFRNLDTAGAFKIRLPSGKVIVLNLIPAVQFEDSDAYFVTHFPSNYDSILEDPFWPLSLAVSEKKILKYYTKRLPKNSCLLHCLQIVTFLHSKQTSLTGKSALTGYHFKTALFHLLINKRPYVWTVDKIDQRLRDVLDFMKRSLQEKRLNHALVGNCKIPKDIQIPQVFLKSDPINLFRCLVLDKALYEATLTHFQEMLRNGPALLQEYTPTMTNGGMILRLNEIL